MEIRSLILPEEFYIFIKTSKSIFGQMNYSDDCFIFSKALGKNNEPKHSEMLAMLAIPADVACRELIAFIYAA